MEAIKVRSASAAPGHALASGLAVALGRSNLKWGDHRLKVFCIDYFGAQGAEHQTA